MNIKDTKPQFLNLNLTMTGANTYTQSSISLPVSPQIGGKSEKARVIELLKVFLFIAPDTLAEDASMYVQLTTNSQAAMIAMNSVEKFIMQFGREFQLVTSGAVVVDTPYVIDLTDGSGNGILVASPMMYFAAASGGQGAALSVGIKILYRFVDIPLAEYIGIVQSQQ